MSSKRFAIIATTVLSLFSQNAFAAGAKIKPGDCRNYGPALRNPGPPSIFSSEMTMESSIYMEKREGVGRFIELPTSYEQIIFEDKEFSATAINDLAQRSEQYWKAGGDARENADLNADGIDATVIADLNISAANAWKAMLACNGNDASAARRNYFMGSPCPQSPEANAQMVQQLSELSGNLVQFTTTSALMTNENPAAPRFIHNTHPLLTQIMFQIQMVYTQLPIERGVQNMGLVNLVANEIRREWSRQDNPYYQPYYSTEERALVIPQLNSMILTTMFVGDQCTEIGLWPAMNRSITRLFQLSSFAGFAGSSAFSSFGEQLDRRVIKACGSYYLGGAYSMFERGNGLYDSFATLHFVETRRLLASYYPTTLTDKKVQRLLQSVTKASGLTPFQKVMCRKK